MDAAVAVTRPLDDAKGVWAALVATGVDRFEAIGLAAQGDRTVAAGLWLQALRMVAIRSGSFTMGAAHGSVGMEDEQPAHMVTLARDFQMGAVPITQGAWLALMGTNPADFKGDLARPVEMVSWRDITNKGGFLAKLNAVTEGARPEGNLFRLPSEAEWEYACRAGCSTPWPCEGDPVSLDDHAWVRSNAGGTTHSVGLKLPNPWGLYDMHGQVWEWCQDWFGGYSDRPQTNPCGPNKGERRVLRGGSWLDRDERCGSASRRCLTPNIRYSEFGSCGFRVVMGVAPIDP
jgi:formylglycine-generating enzyme required for sulfatase activity